jgi:hypothetical protein
VRDEFDLSASANLMAPALYKLLPAGTLLARSSFARDVFDLSALKR